MLLIGKRIIIVSHIRNLVNPSQFRIILCPDMVHCYEKDIKFSVIFKSYRLISNTLKFNSFDYYWISQHIYYFANYKSLMPNVVSSNICINIQYFSL